MNYSHVKSTDTAIHRSEIPRLDLLHSFEAASRLLSFTLAGEELFLTQSAVSRQIQQLEAHLGVALFERHHRALMLTDAGLLLRRTVVDTLARLRDATTLLRAVAKPSAAPSMVSVTTTPGFASLWLIPRLSRFTATHPAVDVRVSATLDVLDLARSQIDLAVRFSQISDGLGIPLFEESVLPMCAPELLKSGTHPLRKPTDLLHHTLLAASHSNDLSADWEPWIQVMGLQKLQMKNSIRFTQYADAVTAAIGGQGVVIGRLPLLQEHIKSKRLVAPFRASVASRRGYYVHCSNAAQGNIHAQDFLAWLRVEASSQIAQIN
jgi:LysR family transcriptional regulator, glycine cleavage system transcriptional activator